MIRILTLMMAAAVLGCSGAVAQEDDIYSPTLRIGWDEFKKQYDDKTIVVVDIRGEGAFETGHIPRARWIPLDDVEKRIPELKRLKKPIVTYCA